MPNPPNIAALLAEAPGVDWSDHVAGYIGPGAGLGGIAILMAMFLGALFLLVGLVWYPLKRMVNGRREGAAGAGRTDEPQ